jgi:uncharacterized protein (DUF2252 family)
LPLGVKQVKEQLKSAHKTNKIVYNEEIFYPNFMTVFSFVPAQRKNEILDELEKWNQSLSAEDLQIKYSKMICSPFSFYRGTNHLFWRDFAKHSALKQFSNKQSQIWIQGDLHAENFGSFHNDQNRIVYDLNDFDESVIADYQYDLWRMAISLVLVARQAKKFKAQEIAEFIAAFAGSYLSTIARCHQAQDEVELEFTADNTYGKLDDFLKDVEKNESRQKMLSTWTNVAQGDRYYDLSSDKLAPVTDDERQAMLQQMPEYGKTLTGKLQYDPQYFCVKDIARRLMAGTGSFGTPRFYIIIEGYDDHHEYDCILDVKRQRKPTPYHYLGKAFQQQYDRQFANDAERYAIAYKALVKNTDDHLGWLKFNDEYYCVRERSPYKESFPLTTLTKAKRFKKMAEQWGKILATSHSRADQDAIGSKINHAFDAAVYQLTTGQESAFIDLVQIVAQSYADQVELDWKTFKRANPKISCFK